MGRFLYVFLLTFFLWHTVKAEDVIRVTADQKEYDLTSSALLLCLDQFDTMNINTFIKTDTNPPLCKTVEAQDLPYGYTDATIWVRSKVQTSKRMENQWIAELDNILLDYLDLYVIKNGKVVQHYETGDRRPFASRPIVGRTYRFPLHLSEGTTELLWKIRSQSSIMLPFMLYDKERLNEIDTQAYFMFGIFYGILLILALYNFILFITFKKSIYFYYVAFILSYVVMSFSLNGFTPLLLSPDFTWHYNKSVLLFLNLALLFSILFGQRFLLTSLYAPTIHKVLNVVLILNIVPLVLSFSDYCELTTRLSSLFSIIVPILLITSGLIVWKENKRRAVFYLLAWSIFFIGTTLFSLHKLGLVPGSWIVMHAQQIGILFKIVVLSYALGDQLQSMLYIDQLTGLANRYSLESIFTSTIRYARKEKMPFAVLILDIDNFKDINDSLSHKQGDKLLQLVAQRLKEYIRTNDTLVRMGQDEFLILLEKVESTEALGALCDYILTHIRKPVTLEEHIVHITASMGIALYPNDGLDYETLMKNSDAALHKAKQIGKNRFHFFNPHLDSAALEHLQLHNDLYKALENQELYLLYQPKINAKDYSLAGVEVLIRWHHPERGVIPPDLFIQVAEENEVILRITRWMLEESFKKLKQWHAAGWQNIFIATNITAKDLHDKYFIKDLMDLLKQYQLSTDVLEVELTERIIISESDENVQRVQALHDIGVNVAVDDFGTGYSTFGYLKSYQVSTIKIDKSFVDDIENDPKAAKIVKAMTIMGHELGMKVVVEGVETKRQVEMLREMNCDVLQGYYFDKPLTEKELVSKYFLKKHNHL